LLVLLVELAVLSPQSVAFSRQHEGIAVGLKQLRTGDIHRRTHGPQLGIIPPLAQAVVQDTLPAEDFNTSGTQVQLKRRQEVLAVRRRHSSDGPARCVQRDDALQEIRDLALKCFRELFLLLLGRLPPGKVVPCHPLPLVLRWAMQTEGEHQRFVIRRELAARVER
jgi:hypothetical protein